MFGKTLFDYTEISPYYYAISQIMQRCFPENTLTVKCRTKKHFYVAFCSLSLIVQRCFRKVGTSAEGILCTNLYPSFCGTYCTPRSFGFKHNNQMATQQDTSSLLTLYTTVQTILLWQTLSRENTISQLLIQIKSYHHMDMPCLLQPLAYRASMLPLSIHNTGWITVIAFWCVSPIVQWFFLF